MNSPLIETPITLDRLDSENAIFVGTADEQLTHSTIFGEIEVEAKYPIAVIQREIWANLGYPTKLMLTLREPE